MATTTFLFVDQVGSTEQLTALGDAVAHERRTVLMAALRDAVTAHRGREVDAAGDGLFAAFESAAEAVEAATAMQQVVHALGVHEPLERTLQVRAGLHAGEPLTNPDGSYFGTAVVVAARLCSRAVAGQVLVSDLVRSLVEPRGEHSFADVGSLTLKGVPAPVTTSELVWEPLDADAQLPPQLAAVSGEPPFVGRAGAMGQLQAALAEAEGGACRQVLVTGESGAGATRTAAELARSAAAAGSTVWYGHAGASGEPMGAWAQALHGWVTSVPRATARWALGPRASDLAGLMSLDGLAPGSGPAVRGGAATYILAEALDDVLTRLSTWAPVVVVLDGLADADPATLHVAERLARSTRRSRVLLVSCAATSSVGAQRVVKALRDVPDLRQVHLAPLTSDDVAAVLTGVTGHEPSPATTAAVLAESEGLPSFVHRMALTQRERDVRDDVARAVQQAEDLRGDLLLRREEISLGLRELDQLRVADVVGPAGPVEPDGTPPADVVCPYRGLLPYGVDQADDLAGRDLLVAELVARLAASRFLAVLGPSGSGKSSAVLAGLLPALARGDLPGSQEWRSLVLVPGSDPLGGLAAALAGLAPPATPDVVRTLLLAHPLDEVVAAVCPGNRLVVVLDQAEELWTASTPATTGRGRLLDLVTGLSQGVVVVMTLRADFYDRVAEHAGLATAVADSQVLVRPLDDRELRAVVEVPARRAGLLLEPGLAQAVVDDVASQPGALPLVSTALLETWQRRRGCSLTLTGYAEAGGVRGAIATLAEAVHAELDDADRQRARRILLRLTTPGADGDDVARRAPLQEVTGDAAAARVLRRLVDARLVTTGAETAAVAHEALLREWPRLRGWLDADRQGRRLHAQLAAAAVDWDRDGRPEDGLLRGARLAVNAEWAAAHDDELTPTERDLLEASAAHRDRELVASRRTARRLKTLATGMAIVLVAALLVGAVALQQRSRAADRARVAEARGLSARAVALAPTQLDRSLLLGVKGYRLDPSEQTADGLATALDAAGPLAGFVRGLPDHVADLAVTSDGSTAYLVLDDAVVPYDTSTWRPSGDPVLSELPNPVNTTLSGDDRWLLVGADDGVHRVDLVDGTASGPFSAGSGTFPQSATSGDGAVFAASTFDDPVVHVYDHATGVEVATFDTGYEQPVVFPVPRAAGFLLGDLGGASDVRRIDASGADTGLAIPFPLASLELMEVSPGATRLLLASGSEAAVVDLTSDQLVGPAVPLPGSRAYSSDWSPDSSTVLVGTDSGAAQLVDAATGQGQGLLEGLAGGLLARFLTNSTVVVAPITTGEPALYDLDVVSPLATTIERRDAVLTSVVPSGAGSTEVYLAGLSGVTRRQPLPGSDDVSVVTRRDWFVQAVAASPSGGQIAVRGVATPSPQVPLAGGVLTRQLVAVVDTDGQVLWETSLGDTPDPPGALAWSPAGDRLANIGPDGELTVFDALTGDHAWPGVAVDFYAGGALVWSRDGERLFAGGQSGVLSVVDAGSGEVVHRTELADVFQLSGAVVVPGTGFIAVSSESGEVFLVDEVSGDQVGRPMNATGAQLQAVAVTPSGDRVAAVDRTGALWMWDVATRRRLGPALRGHASDASAVVFQDERTVLTTGFDGRLLRWDLDPSSWVDDACRLAGRELTAQERAEDLPDRDRNPVCAGQTGA